MKTNSGKFITNGVWFYDELHHFIGSTPRRRRGNGRKKFRLETPHGDYLINLHSPRLQCFKRNPKCAYCHRVGALWFLQKQSTDTEWHLNLYALETNDTLVLMTRDHIFPVSRGGVNAPSNSATACEPCNKKKGAAILGLEDCHEAR